VATVLIVDDEPNIRLLLRRILDSLKCTVFEAADVKSAIAILEQSTVDLAFIDVRMPGPDGLWLADNITERFPRTAVVFATGMQELDPRATLRRGVMAYLVKPFRYEEVADVIRAFERTGSSRA
jgi:two-component system OmpR family response regulator